MAIEKMRLISIVTDKEYLNEVLARFCSLGKFHGVLASKYVGNVEGVTLLKEENPFEEEFTFIKEMAHEMGYVLKEEKVEIEEEKILEMQEELFPVIEKYRQAKKIKKEVENLIQENKDAMIQLEHLQGLGISLDDILSCQYLKAHFGRLPLDSVEKLKYYKNKPFLFQSFHKDQVYSWCMYMTTPRYEGEVDNIFSSLYFERITIPSFVHGEPNKANENLAKEIEDDKKQLAHVEEIMHGLLEENKTKMNRFYSILIRLNAIYEARKYVVCMGERISVSGFVGKSDVSFVKEAFMDMQDVVEIEDRPAHSDKRLQPPTRLKNGWWSKPFSFFVKMYGMPGYDDIDPTAFVSITYTLLFGMMFGDVGQGILLALFAQILYKMKGWDLAAIGVRIGLSSAFFGLLYGSVFGNETLLNPMYQIVFHLKEKPIEVLDPSFTMTLLLIAVGLGSCLILVSILVNVILQFKRRNIGEALFSQNGISGLLFYSAVLLAIVGMFTGAFKINVIYVGVCFVIPILFMFLKEPLTRIIEHKEMFPDGFRAFFVESFFELFEIMLSFVSNTMSFLRVGGFVLSHAGMMLVVMTLAEMVGPSFSWLVLLFGNLFVMCLEGLIVGIQVLRLEFYEMFSRYFEGKGIAFQSIELK